MPRLLLVAALAVGVTLVAGCSSGPLSAIPTRSDLPTTRGSVPTLSEGTCWTGARLGDDPQDVLKLSASSGVPYLVAARAVADRPSFTSPVSCGADHAVEVFKVVRLPRMETRLADYSALLRIQAPAYAKVVRSVRQGCMTKALAEAAARSALPGAVMMPVLPAGATVGWAPAAPAQWAKGQRVFACTLTWSHPEQSLYTSVFTKGFATSGRTCIDDQTLTFVDCARPHDRERIAVIDARDAVAAGAFPGPAAVKDGPQGRALDVPDAAYSNLDAACTAYLRTISTTTKLRGIANVDADQWPLPDGTYPIYCDADRKPAKDPLVTEGSVYDR